MTSGKDLDTYLGYLLKAFDATADYVSGVSEADFLADGMRQDAVIRNIEIAGEVSNSLVRHHPDFTSFAAKVPFVGIYDMRNVLTHSYHRVNPQTVWMTAKIEFPQFRADLQTAIDTFPRGTKES